MSFDRESPEMSPGLPLSEAERRVTPMILLLIKLRLAIAGRLTALILWTRKGHK